MKRALGFLVLAGMVLPLRAAELPRVFADGMVLQRDQPIPVWGRSAPGAKLRVTLDGRKAKANADAAGNWRVLLPPHAAGGPFELRITDDGKTQVVRDVLVGDVWLASGQSNMEWPIAQSRDAEAEIQRATDPLIRHFKIPKSWAGEPQWQLAGGQWQAASPQVAGSFSAVAHFFARELRKSTGVPIGIIDSSWGGSNIEAWTDAATLKLSADDVAAQAAMLEARDRESLRQTQANTARWPTPVDDSDWSQATLDTSAWAELPVPALWESAGWNGMDGIAWYRAEFDLNAQEARAGVSLGVGRIDDSDTTWVNGVQVGQTRMQYNQVRVYAVPASALRAGRNTIAVRVEDTGGGGGIHGQPQEVFVQPNGGAARVLAGTWKFRPARVTVALVDDKNQHPTLLYNAMIHPLQPYGLRGVIWYQGESNAYALQAARDYRDQFQSMIGQWRTQWQAPALPFLWVQLASFGSGVDRGADSPWALLRESQTAALRLPATAQVVSIDIGDSHDIHPRNKQDVGRRLALAARHVAYGESLVHAGPMQRGVQFDGDAVRVQFDNGGAALAVRGDGELRGFELAGDDRVFHPARARIEGDAVIVRSDAVPVPRAVRYGWRDDAADANLGNAEGLPASPFRSDDW
ncbi:MAG: sialate O-acetylesterase [Thermomonas sp.]|uniref:sialate O-acetylesterase n=1 Tax=Thermomonas sp. TaxID=1971895 RepID=UPI0039E5ABA5